MLLVPTSKDASVANRLLTEGKLRSVTCSSIAEAVQELTRGAAAILTTEEIIADSDAGPLLAALEHQPGWSDLPIIVLARDGTHSPRAVGVLDRLTNVTILERPAPLRSVLSAVQAAARGRRRQYEMRRQLQVVREAEARAQRSERAKDEFLAALSHELRTPLSPVLLLATEYSEDATTPDEARRAFETIAKNVSLEARLIDDLLDLTRIARGKLDLVKSPVDLIHVVKDAMANVRPDFEAKSISLFTDLHGAPAIVEADPVRLQQVIWNVLRNAAKFTSPGGHVWIRTMRPAGSNFVQVEVRDDGMGMTEDEIGRIFDAFAQGNHSARSGGHRFGGLGLGLAISRSLVQMHRGEITASSQGLGLGSTFTISLPLADTALPPTAPNEAAIPASGKIDVRVLLVEDHGPTRAVLKNLLSHRCREVRSAGSAGEARQVARTFEFDVLISDLGLPDGSGYELIAEFRRHGDIRGIALTGYGMAEDIRRSEQAGFLAHLVKPLDIHTLDAALKKVAAPAQPADEGWESD